MYLKEILGLARLRKPDEQNDNLVTILPQGLLPWVEQDYVIDRADFDTLFLRFKQMEPDSEPVFDALNNQQNREFRREFASIEGVKKAYLSLLAELSEPVVPSEDAPPEPISATQFGEDAPHDTTTPGEFMDGASPAPAALAGEAQTSPFAHGSMPEGGVSGEQADIEQLAPSGGTGIEGLAPPDDMDAPDAGNPTGFDSLPADEDGFEIPPEAPATVEQPKADAHVAAPSVQAVADDGDDEEYTALTNATHSMAVPQGMASPSSASQVIAPGGDASLGVVGAPVMPGVGAPNLAEEPEAVEDGAASPDPVETSGVQEATATPEGDESAPVGDASIGEGIEKPAPAEDAPGEGDALQAEPVEDVGMDGEEKQEILPPAEPSEEDLRKKVCWEYVQYIQKFGSVPDPVEDWAAACVQAYNEMLTDYQTIFQSATIDDVFAGNGISAIDFYESIAQLVYRPEVFAEETSVPEGNDGFLVFLRFCLCESLLWTAYNNLDAANAIAEKFGKLIYEE